MNARQMHGVVEVHLEHRPALLIHQEQHAVLVAEVQCRPFGSRVSERPRVDVISTAIPTLSISLSVNNAGIIAITTYILCTIVIPIRK